MKRPLLISDCDEVLLHMVSHFAEWLETEHGIRFAVDSGRFSDAMTVLKTGEQLKPDQACILLDAFFRSEMHRQTLVPGAVEALGRIGEVADIIIIITNLANEAHRRRVEQLASHGIRHDIVCNSGGKGAAVKKLAKRRPSAVFVDDLPRHHASVARHAPNFWRLHMIADPRIARPLRWPSTPTRESITGRPRPTGSWTGSGRTCDHSSLTDVEVRTCSPSPKRRADHC